MNLELNIKTKKQLEEFLSLIDTTNNIEEINITDKKSNLDKQIAIEKLIDGTDNSIRLVPHFSLTENYSGSETSAFNNLISFINFCKRFDQRIKHVLLVSGHPANKLDSVRALKKLSEHNIGVKIACAYTSYPTSNPEYPQEISRLKNKLSHDFVSRVYIQLTDNLELIRSAVDKLREFSQETEIFQSILIPDRQILNNLKFRTWHGVNYSNKYLNDLEFAQKKTSEIVEFCEQNRIEALYETLNKRQILKAIEFD